MCNMLRGSTACLNHVVPEGLHYVSDRDWGDRGEKSMSYVLYLHLGE
jgi:hypothetical protein